MDIIFSYYPTKLMPSYLQFCLQPKIPQPEKKHNIVYNKDLFETVKTERSKVLEQRDAAKGYRSSQRGDSRQPKNRCRKYLFQHAGITPVLKTRSFDPRRAQELRRMKPGK